ncbi:hypothetical protein D3C75_974160 [compost metagenome]
MVQDGQPDAEELHKEYQRKAVQPLHLGKKALMPLVIRCVVGIKMLHKKCAHRNDAQQGMQLTVEIRIPLHTQKPLSAALSQTVHKTHITIFPIISHVNAAFLNVNILCLLLC